MATGVWHHYLITGDRDFLQRLWPTVERAIDFVLAQQTTHGDIHWAVHGSDNVAQKDALLTGCSSIYKSLECALAIAGTLDADKRHWAMARARLHNAILNKPERFDRTWESKQRYSMDWFYPVLAGAITGDDARRHLDERWDEFVVDGLGCRCVTDEPWITVAESCELVMSLIGGRDARQGRRTVQLAAPVA